APRTRDRSEGASARGPIKSSTIRLSQDHPDAGGRRFLDGWGGYCRHGNSTQQLDGLDWYVQNRLCRFIARKYGRRGTRRGLAVLLDSKSRLGLHRLAGTVS